MGLGDAPGGWSDPLLSEAPAREWKKEEHHAHGTSQPQEREHESARRGALKFSR